MLYEPKQKFYARSVLRKIFNVTSQTSELNVLQNYCKKFDYTSEDGTEATMDKITGA
jgi:hypothetical protein